MSYQQPYRDVTRADLVRESGAMSQVYAWMMAGLLVTGAVAMFVANTPVLLGLIFSSPFVFFGLIIVELVLVWVISANIMKMSPGMATGAFLGYSALNGLTISVIFLLYTQASIASTFFITAGTFAVMSLYGYTTKRDLTSLGNLLFMGLIGFIIASVVNIFLQNEVIYWIVTYGGVLIFVGLTAYHNQKIKEFLSQGGDEATIHRITIIGALILYLDFINLFLLLLRIFGGRR